MRAQMNLPGAMEEPAAQIFGWLVTKLAMEGGTLTFGESNGTHTVGLEFGKEAEDSPMVGGAAYGVGSSLTEALQVLMEDLGVEAYKVEVKP